MRKLIGRTLCKLFTHRKPEARACSIKQVTANGAFVEWDCSRCGEHLIGDLIHTNDLAKVMNVKVKTSEVTTDPSYLMGSRGGDPRYIQPWMIDLAHKQVQSTLMLLANQRLLSNGKGCAVDYKAKLAYLLKRLVSIKCDECRDAAVLVENAIQNGSECPRPDEEIALYHSVWGCITRALDVVGNLSIEEQLMLDAMEAEMAGYVLTARQAKGELVYRVEPTPTTTGADGRGGAWAPLAMVLIIVLGLAASIVAFSYSPAGVLTGLTVAVAFLATGCGLAVVLRGKSE